MGAGSLSRWTTRAVPGASTGRKAHPPLSTSPGLSHSLVPSLARQERAARPPWGGHHSSLCSFSIWGKTGGPTLDHRTLALWSAPDYPTVIPLDVSHFCLLKTRMKEMSLPSRRRRCPYQAGSWRWRRRGSSHCLLTCSGTAGQGGLGTGTAPGLRSLIRRREEGPGPCGD